MGIHVFYGEDNISMDKHYLEFRRLYQKVFFLEPLSLQAIEEQIANPGFFPEKKLFVGKNVFLNQLRVGKMSAKLRKELEFLQKHIGNNDFLFLEEDSRKAKYYRQFFPKANYLEFKISAYLFTFLDNFRPGKLGQCYQYWQKALIKNPPELVLFMLKRRVRELITLATGTISSRYQSWQVAKLKQQLASWEPDKLRNLYNSFYNYEKGLKTGINPLKSEQVINTVIALYL